MHTNFRKRISNSFLNIIFIVTEWAIPYLFKILNLYLSLFRSFLVCFFSLFTCLIISFFCIFFQFTATRGSNPFCVANSTKYFLLLWTLFQYLSVYKKVNMHLCYFCCLCYIMTEYSKIRGSWYFNWG